MAGPLEKSVLIVAIKDINRILGWKLQTYNESKEVLQKNILDALNPLVESEDPRIDALTDVTIDVYNTICDHYDQPKEERPERGPDPTKQCPSFGISRSRFDRECQRCSISQRCKSTILRKAQKERARLKKLAKQYPRIQALADMFKAEDGNSHSLAEWGEIFHQRYTERGQKGDIETANWWVNKFLGFLVYMGWATKTGHGISAVYSCELPKGGN